MHRLRSLLERVRKLQSAELLAMPGHDLKTHR
jgi:hypothetical protein